MRLRIVVHPVPRRYRNGRTWSLAAVAGTAALAAAALSAAGRAPAWLPACAFKAVTGLPCPLCGMTTAAVCLARGDLAGAWQATALAPAAGACFVLAVVYTYGFRLLAGRRLELAADAPARRMLRLAGGAVVAAAWGVNLSRWLA